MSRQVPYHPADGRWQVQLLCCSECPKALFQAHQVGLPLGLKSPLPCPASTPTPSQGPTHPAEAELCCWPWAPERAALQRSGPTLPRPHRQVHWTSVRPESSLCLKSPLQAGRTQGGRRGELGLISAASAAAGAPGNRMHVQGPDSGRTKQQSQWAWACSAPRPGSLALLDHQEPPKPFRTFLSGINSQNGLFKKPLRPWLRS